MARTDKPGDVAAALMCNETLAQSFHTPTDLAALQSLRPRAHTPIPSVAAYVQELGLLAPAHPSVVNRLLQETEALERALGKSTTGGLARCCSRYKALGTSWLGAVGLLARAASWGAGHVGSRRSAHGRAKELAACMH